MLLKRLFDHTLAAEFRLWLRDGVLLGGLQVAEVGRFHRIKGCGDRVSLQSFLGL